MENSLDQLRKQIDTIDSQIISLLSERFDIVKQIGLIKKNKNKSPLDEERWNEVVANRKKLASNEGISEELIESIWNTIHEHALKIESENDR